MKRAWVVGAYGNNGGNHMNYHIAKICKYNLNLNTFSISADTSLFHSENIFGHKKEFTEYSIKDFISMHQESDILISNPSFSRYLFGYNAKCAKIMYVQHYNTFRWLDLKFNHYVSVSSFVNNYLKVVYNLNSSVISAFTETANSFREFENKEESLLVYPKNRQAHLNYFERSVKSLLDIGEIRYTDRQLNRVDFLDKLDSSKYLLTLSIDEGFGLVSLEAMNRGVIVFGFNGNGGKDYLIRSYNSMTNDYPDWEGVKKSINQTIKNKSKCEKLSQNALLTASEYSYEKFEKAT